MAWAWACSSTGSGRLEQLPLEDRAVDALITPNTLYFVDDVDAVFVELARVLRSGGRAVVASVTRSRWRRCR